MTRNVVIQGDESSKAQLFGVHTMAMHSGSYRISGTEVRNCGQSGVLGRYCTHFHMVGTRPDAYIKDNSVHDSYQRVVSVHASNEVVVANNVGYNIRAHAFFVEDGKTLWYSCVVMGGVKSQLGRSWGLRACSTRCTRLSHDPLVVFPVASLQRRFTPCCFCMRAW